MPKPPRYLKQLEHELLALGDDAMLLEELDGFIAGLLVCPELIKPSEWLPVVWGSEGEDDPAFDSLDHLNRVLGLVMEHYNDIARTLIERPGRYGPRFAVDKRHNEILWEIWVAGFEKAVRLRPPAWPTRTPSGLKPWAPNGEVPAVPIHLLPPWCLSFCSSRRLLRVSIN